MRTTWRIARSVVLAAALLTGCEGLGDIVDPVDDLDPTLTELRYRWVDQGWTRTSALAPVGQPSVELGWDLPEDWNGEAFRVYSRQSNRSTYLLTATVTSCGAGSCRYTDLNVTSGESYDYYVVTLDANGREIGSSEAWQVRVPSYGAPEAPAAPTAVALDGAVFLRWASTGAERYRVFLERVGADSVFFEIGASDGVGYLDTRAANGTRYGYRIAAVDTLGHVSARTALALATPRPDYQAEIIYPLSDSAAASGFRFVGTASENPIVAGTSSSAQWRVETGSGGLRIVPLGQTRVTQGVFTTALTCGPGADADCESVDRAPAASAFGTSPVPVSAGNTYVFRVVGGDGRARYAKVRVDGHASDAAGRTVVVFDWAYQLVADEQSLRLGQPG